MRVLNWSYRVGCLQCSFSDKSLNEYIQLKKRKVVLQKKRAVQKVGRQPDNVWILGENICISSNGMINSSSKHIWISNVFSGMGIPSQSMGCNISLPLSTEPLNPLLNALCLHFSHNFYPALLLIGSAAFVLHYQELIKHLRYCPIPLAFGESGTGKTTALECAMSLLGAQESRMYSKITREKIFDLCCNSAGIPLGVDDPHSKTDINKLLVDLYNGKKGATMGKGERIPSSTSIIASNFSPEDRGRSVNVITKSCGYLIFTTCRYASRCLMIPFRLPQVSMTLSQYMEIVSLQKRAGSCVGLLIGLGDRFFSSGISIVDNEIIPMILEKAPAINVRVVPSYAMLLWFTLEVLCTAYSFAHFTLHHLHVDSKGSWSRE